ncbi:hypothetical protein ISN45_Aa08g016880 [Arabidopsis thaliana x Arabidopsis arenosa]|uniref:Uncharacterized protein n=1 Tax=Arabidopsis thaliana x Arabidopsis arenosa TaxID=1240361 RepID=A0A8T1XSC8_9BRAS|nr:hypothetical protein ISN45_Aa08g016880 [Arabidopsis thaliana x Arabidopsis arenosa]
MNPVLGFTSCFSNVESIPMLNGSNFSEWKEHLLVVLALMDLDISLREERPKHIDIVKTERWDRSNRMSMMIMKIRIPPKFRGIVPKDVTTAKEALAALEKCYVKKEGAEVRTVLAEFRSTKKANESVREYIMMKMTVAAKLKKLGMDIPDTVVAALILDSLPSDYELLRSTYNRLQLEWSTHDLISHCVQEEERLTSEKKEHDLVAGKVICDKKRKHYDECL